MSDEIKLYSYNPEKLVRGSAMIEMEQTNTSNRLQQYEILRSDPFLVRE